MKIIKCPINYGALSKKGGQDKAPDKIIDNLKNFYLKENGFLPVFDIESINIDNKNIDESNKKIYEKIKNLEVPGIIIGGDHCLTYSSFKGLSQNYSNPGLVIFDAHLDCVNNFSPPTHEDYLRVLIEEGHLKKKNVVIIGLRNYHSKEIDFAKKNNLKIFDMKEFTNEGKREICDSIMSVSKNFDGLYISIDIDVLDPAFAPGTGYTEPGGLTTRELIYFVQRLKNLKNLKMIDLVEVDPGKDINELTVITASKFIVELS